jgi:beta-N-acetylhexosaminidase
MKVLGMPFKCALLILLATVFADTVFAQNEGFIQSLNQKNQWVDSVYKRMSRKEKVAQFFFIRARTDKGQAFEDSVGKIIRKQHIGGLVFFQGGPVRQAQLINRYQSLAKIPLLIAMDGEWGLGMRLDSTISYPFQMTLGAVQDNQLIYRMGTQVAYDFKRLGMQMNLGPDMDINNNPDNPVINYRSFGDNKYNVAAKGIAYMKGMQDAGLLTAAKHFPGHGDTNVDSHLDLPLLPFTRKRLDSLEEYPFHEAIKAGISGVMIAHMDIPALDTTKNLPSTLSHNVITRLLKDSLGFKGLVVSDAMEMKAVVKYFPDGDADLKAFLAGNDIIELSENSKLAIKLIKKAVRKKLVSKEEFETRVKKLLEAKYWAGLNKRDVVSVDNLVSDLNRLQAKELVQQLSDAAVTLIKGDVDSIPMNPQQKTAIVSIGVASQTVFQDGLSKKYANSSLFQVAKDMPAAALQALQDSLSQFSQVFVSINDTRPRPAGKLNYTDDVKRFIASLASHPNTVICVFANAYTIVGLPGIEKCRALLVCYQMTDYLQRSAIKVITRQINPNGRLPVTINPLFITGKGLTIQ